MVLADGALEVREVEFMARAAAALGEPRETALRMLREAEEA